MFLIDKPYISDFLLDTIKKNNYSVVATSIAKNMITDNKINWITEDKAAQLINSGTEKKVYTNSENAIAWIERHLTNTTIPYNCDIFKNKIKFRNLVTDHFPNYFYRGMDYDQLSKIDPHTLPFPLVVKPAVGFFSIAVNKVDSAEEWQQTITKINQDIQEMAHLYPDEVVNIDKFIIESIIEGEEFAVDAYYDDQGLPVILNILHHLFSSGKDVSDRVYTTSIDIVKTHYNEVNDFLKLIGEKLSLKNIPLHVEVRIDKHGNLAPIEINPMRFGGWCTTADLTVYAYGFNSYEYFMAGKKPDWNTLFSGSDRANYSIIILDNNSGISAASIDQFDYDKLWNDFDQPLDLRTVNFREQPFFGIIFVKSTDETEIKNILTSDLTPYIQQRSTGG